MKQRYGTLNLISSVALVGAMITCAAPAVAAPVLVGSTTNPTGINGLLVNGTQYDVTFSTDTYNNTFTSPQFSGSQSGDAATALAAAFNGLGVTGFGGYDCYNLASATNVDGHYLGGGCDVMTPFSDSIPGTLNVGASSTGWLDFPPAAPPVSWDFAGWTYSNGDSPTGWVPLNDTYYAWAVYTTVAAPGAPVPEPGTWMLMVVGLTGLVAARKKLVRFAAWK